MGKIVLIHGFGTWRESSMFFSSEGNDGGFRGFKDLVEHKKVSAFRWGIKKHFSFIQALNPLAHISLYFKEKRMSEDMNTLERLNSHLKNEEPRTIICHSMGCLLLSNFLKYYTLPSSVKNVIFIQADLPRDVKSFRNRLEKLSATSVELITNFFCPWDFTLIGSAIINGYIPAGLTGLKATKTKNIFYPLRESWPIHNSSIRSQRFAAEMIEKYAES